MAQYKSLSDAFKNISKTIDKSKKQAMKRALVSARTEYTRALTTETGLKTGDLKRRVRFEKQKQDYPDTISFGTRTLFAAHAFAMKAVRMVTRLGKRTGVAIKSPTETFLPGSFIIKGKTSGKRIIVHRTSTANYPIKTTVVNVFQKAVANNYDRIKKAFVESYKKNFASQIKFNSNK